MKRSKWQLRQFNGRLRSSVAVLAMFLAVLAASESALADTTAAVRDQAAAISDSIMSPFCPGRTLSACPSNDARLLREEIEAWLGQGIPANEVKIRLQNLYGATISGQPERRGLGILGWAIPPMLVVGGFAVVVLVLRGMRRYRPSGGPVGSKQAVHNADVQDSGLGDNDSRAAAADDAEAPRLSEAVESFTARIEEELRQRIAKGM